MKFKDLFNEDLTVKWDVVESVPEFAALKGCPQHVLWHREGDAWNHTQGVVEAMYALLNPDKDEEHSEMFNVPEPMKRVLMYAALCHDLGKPKTTKKKADGHWGARDHDDAGARIVRQLFRDDDGTPYHYQKYNTENDFDLTFVVANLTALHMKLHYLLENREKFDDKGINEYLINLDRRCYIGIWPLIILLMADDLGSDNEYTIEYFAQCAEFLDRKCKELEIGRWLDSGLVPYVPERKGDFFCYVMMGLPGAGKSSVVAKMATPRNNVKVFSNDAIRREDFGLNGFGTPEQEKEIRKVCWERIENACKEKASFIVDNTNISKWIRWRIAQEVWKNGGKVLIIFIDTPIEKCIARRYNMITEETIRSMDRNLDLPTLRESDGILVAKHLDEDTEFSLLPPCDYIIDTP